jgi:manganese oxidase
MRALLSAIALVTLLASPALATDADPHAGHHSMAPAVETELPAATEAVSPAAADSPGQVPVVSTEPDGPTNLLPVPVESVPMESAAPQNHSAHGSGHGSHDMTILSPAGLPEAASDRQGGTELASELLDGVRVFKLTADEIAWPITDDVKVYAMAYNGQVPGPMIRVKAGEKIRVVFTNKLAEPSTIHWHGVDVPIEMDGVVGISQDPVPPEGTFNYEFTVPNTPGTFFYHTHVMPDKQQALGLSGAFIIEPATPPKSKAFDSEYTLLLSEWTVKDGGNRPSMPMEGMLPNYFTFNGKSWPDTQKIQAKVGERILLRVINAGAFAHPIHLHGAPFKVVATDGRPVPAAAQLTKDTLSIAPGERYDLLWTPNRPGSWLVHCHINHHTMNDGKEVDGMGGMALAIEVSP